MPDDNSSVAWNPSLVRQEPLASEFDPPRPDWATGSMAWPLQPEGQPRDEESPPRYVEDPLREVL